MRLTRLARQITTYRLRAASDGEHRLLIEQPLLAGWSLATPDPTHVEFSADGYRIPVTLTGSKQNNVVVTMERPLEETIRLETWQTIGSAWLIAAMRRYDPSIVFCSAIPPTMLDLANEVIE